MENVPVAEVEQYWPGLPERVINPPEPAPLPAQPKHPSVTHLMLREAQDDAWHIPQTHPLTPRDRRVAGQPLRRTNPIAQVDARLRAEGIPIVDGFPVMEAAIQEVQRQLHEDPYPPRPVAPAPPRTRTGQYEANAAPIQIEWRTAESAEEAADRLRAVGTATLAREMHLPHFGASIGDTLAAELAERRAQRSRTTAEIPIMRPAPQPQQPEQMLQPEPQPAPAPVAAPARPAANHLTPDTPFTHIEVPNAAPESQPPAAAPESQPEPQPEPEAAPTPPVEPKPETQTAPQPEPETPPSADQPNPTEEPPKDREEAWETPLRDELQTAFQGLAQQVRERGRDMLETFVAENPELIEGAVEAAQFTVQAVRKAFNFLRNASRPKPARVV